jgi:hypothetical protein
MSRALTNTEWQKFCAAAGRKPVIAEAEAREMLSAILFDERPFEPYDYEREEVRRERLTRMVAHLNAFTADYCAEFTPADDAVRTSDIKIRIKPDLWCLEGLRRRTELALLAAHTRQRQNTGHRNAQHAMLYFRLCELWLDYFEGALQSPVQPELPPPGRFRTPLVKFVQEAMRRVMPPLSKLPKGRAVRDAIDLECQERAKLKRWKEQLRRDRLRREREGG